MNLEKVHQAYLSSFPAWEKESGMLASNPAWLKGLRDGALAQFERTGFPSPKEEAWRYTNLDAFFRLPFLPWGVGLPASQGAGDLLANLPLEKDAHLFVFVNGVHSPSLSKYGKFPRGTKALPLSQAWKEDGLEEGLGQVIPYEGRPFTALNTAFFTDGLYLSVPEGKEIEGTIHVVHLSLVDVRSAQSHLRHLILLARGARAKVVEHYLGEGSLPYLLNTVTEVRLFPGAALDHTKVQTEGLGAFHVGTLRSDIQEGSSLCSRTFSFGGAFARTEVEAILGGRKAECTLEGLYLSKGRQQMDHRTFVDHAVPSCTSHQTFKGVLDGEGTGIFDGKVLVRENAQKTDARQQNKNLQLSKESKVHSKPQLQIYADDVKCSHGSATGQLDEEALFYFRSRGIGREEAKRTLVYAFAGEMVDRVPLESLKLPLKHRVEEWMAAGRSNLS
jgi:Fe-S cluster assembly protein SufD